MYLSISLLLSSLPLPPGCFSQGKQKNAAAIATESKGRPGPGLSPLERPDWLRPAVWALLPCGRRGRQFSERCRGRRAISAVLSGWIYAAASELIFSLLWHILWLDKGNLSTTVHINHNDRAGETICWFIDCLLTLAMSQSLLDLGEKQTAIFSFLHTEWKYSVFCMVINLMKCHDLN